MATIQMDVSDVWEVREVLITDFDGNPDYWYPST
jgi:hypothetical protein